MMYNHVNSSSTTAPPKGLCSAASGVPVARPGEKMLILSTKPLPNAHTCHICHENIMNIS